MSRSLIATAFRLRRAYSGKHGRAPRLLRPRRFTEKIQWRKLFDFNPLFATLCDKIAVRDYIAERVGPEHLIPLLWSGAPADIPFDAIARPYFLKSSHSSGQVIMIGREDVLDATAIRERAARWLTINHGLAYDEPGYAPVPPRLMIEQTVTTADGARPDELRFFVFDGKVAVINTVFVEDGRIRSGAFHTRDWTRLNWHFTRVVDRSFPRPSRLDEMITVAERLGEGLDHVRVDIYDCGDRIWIGELTLYSWSGYSRFDPDEADFELGSYWRIRSSGWRPVVAALFGGRTFGARAEMAKMTPGMRKSVAGALERTPVGPGTGQSLDGLDAVAESLQ
ncbi:MAG: ATP-grasp fold amidoligase family protein [Gemmatimonadaceae bacterium]